MFRTDNVFTVFIFRTAMCPAVGHRAGAGAHSKEEELQAVGGKQGAHQGDASRTRLPGGEGYHL